MAGPVPASLRFAESAARWLEFYQQHGADVDGEANEQGWLNFNCPLPTHPKSDKGRHAAINVYSGNFRCFNEECRQAYVEEVGKPADSEVLTPREWLILAAQLDVDDALRIAEEYRSETDPEPESGGFSKTYHGPLAGAEALLAAARKRLDPKLEIVHEYCLTRGLSYDTLKRFGVGYVPENGRQEACLVLPYTVDGKTVGLRGRTIDGRKGAAENSWLTLFNLSAIDETEAGVCVIVEGETDTLRLSQALVDADAGHVPVLGTPGVRFEREWARHLQQFHHVVLIPQADHASTRLVRDVSKSIDESRLHILDLPWRPKQWGKDVADFALQNDLIPIVDEIASLAADDEAPRILSPRELRVLALTPVSWVVPGLIERGTKTLLVGPPKTLKTFMAITLIHSVCNGTPFLGVPEWQPPGGGRAMLVEEEGSLRRLAERFCLVMGNQLDHNDSRLSVLHRQLVRLDEPTSLGQLRRDIQQAQPDLVVLDPYAELHSQDENTVQGTQVVIAALNQLMAACPGSALVLLHHTPKDGTGPRGSGSLWGAFDTKLEVSIDEATDRIRLKVDGRDLPRGQSNVLDLSFSDDCQFTSVTDATEQARTEHDHLVAKLGHILRSNAKPSTVAAIAKQVSLQRRKTRALLDEMADDKRASRIGDGTRGDPFKYGPPVEEPEDDREENTGERAASEGSD